MGPAKLKSIKYTKNVNWKINIRFINMFSYNILLFKFSQNNCFVCAEYIIKYHQIQNSIIYSQQIFIAYLY